MTLSLVSFVSVTLQQPIRSCVCFSAGLRLRLFAAGRRQKARRKSATRRLSTNQWPVLWLIVVERRVDVRLDSVVVCVVQ